MGRKASRVATSSEALLPNGLPVHLSNEDLLSVLYGVDSPDVHVTGCQSCEERLSALRQNRETIERTQPPTLDVRVDRLAAQRRAIYARLSQPMSFWSKYRTPHWISAGATAMILGGGLFIFQHQPLASYSQQRVHLEDKISDADLAQEVSSLSQNVEANPAEPLKGLFE